MYFSKRNCKKYPLFLIVENKSAEIVMKMENSKSVNLSESITLEIGRLTTFEEFRELQDLDKLVWELNEREVLPFGEVRVVAEIGAIIGAKFRNKLIGFIFALPRLPNRHHSHKMGIHPLFQHLGVGFHLKKYHRELALSQGIEIIDWTFDPLLAPNAYLNFHKLGGIAFDFYEDYYGDMPRDIAIYRALGPTDRFLLEWHINTKRVDNYLNEKRANLAWYLEYDAEIVTRTKHEYVNEVPTLKLINWEKQTDKDYILVEVPSNYRTLAEKYLKDPSGEFEYLAENWRFKFRKIMNFYLKESNYFVCDYLSTHEENTRKNYYVLAKKELYNQIMGF